MKFSIKVFFRKWDQIPGFLRILAYDLFPLFSLLVAPNVVEQYGAL